MGCVTLSSLSIEEMDAAVIIFIVIGFIAAAMERGGGDRIYSIREFGISFGALY